MNQRACFELDVIPLRGHLLSTALRLTRNTQDAEDLVQETMLHAYTGFGSLREGSNVKAWMYRILHNTWISQYRKKKCRPTEVSVECIADTQLIAGIGHSANTTRSAEETALEFVTDDEVAAALMQLAPEIQTALYYADVLGYTYKEIAAMTDSPIGTVMSRLHRGRNRLRKRLFTMANRCGLVAEQESADSARAA